MGTKDTLIHVHVCNSIEVTEGANPRKYLA